MKVLEQVIDPKGRVKKMVIVFASSPEEVYTFTPEGASKEIRKIEKAPASPAETLS